MGRTQTALVTLMMSMLLPTMAAAQADALGTPPPVERAITISVVAPPAVSAPAEDAPVDTVFEEPAAREVDAAPAPPAASSTRLALPSGYQSHGAVQGPALAVAPVAPVGVMDTRRTPGQAVDESDSPSRLPRIGTMALVGGATMVAAGFGMYELGCAVEGGHDTSGCDAVGYTLAAVSALSLTPLSVYLSGTLMDGNGGYGWTLMGTGIGLAAGTLGGLAVAVSGGTGDQSLIPLMIGPTLGAIIVYELSSDPSREQAEALASGATWSASIAPTDSGGMVSVAGTF